MPVLFADNPGRVVALKDPNTTADMRRMVEVRNVDTDLTFAETRSIITRVTVGQEANAQFLHTLGSDIYVYSFGDRVGQMTLFGTCFATECAAGDDKHGMEQMLDWYDKHRLSARREPIEVVLGSRAAVTAFVTGMQVDVVNPAMRLAQYHLALALIPDPPPRLSRNAGGFGPGGPSA